MFNKIDISMFQEYMTKYPNGTSIFESLSKTLTSFNSYVEEINAKFGTLPEQMQALLNSSQLTADELKALEQYFTIKAAAIADLEAAYAPELNNIVSQLAETMNKTAVTLSHQFADNTARDNYFTANPLEKINLTFIKVGTAYQQLLNNAWTSANPVLVEAVNQIDDANTGLSKTLSASKQLELLALKVNKSQEAWITATLTNGGVGTIKYKKDDLGIVYVNIALTTVPMSVILATLPSGYRPKDNLFWIANANSSTIFSRGYLDTSGRFTSNSANAISLYLIYSSI